MKLFAIAIAAVLPSLSAFQLNIDTSKVTGNPAAPVQLEVYSDFACPACRGFHETMLPMLIRDYVNPGKAFIVHREFPLIMIPDHKHSREAAIWATAASRVGKYKEAASALFKGQGTWNVTGRVADTVLPAIPAADRAKVTALAKDPAIAQSVKRDMDVATATRINETPTMVIRRGTKNYTFPGPAPNNYNLLKSLIDGLLK